MGRACLLKGQVTDYDSRLQQHMLHYLTSPEGDLEFFMYS